MPYSAISSVCCGGGCNGASARFSDPVTALFQVPTASINAVRWWSRGARSVPLTLATHLPESVFLNSAMVPPPWRCRSVAVPSAARATRTSAGPWMA